MKMLGMVQVGYVSMYIYIYMITYVDTVYDCICMYVCVHICVCMHACLSSLVSSCVKFTSHGFNNASNPFLCQSNTEYKRKPKSALMHEISTVLALTQDARTSAEVIPLSTLFRLLNLEKATKTKAMDKSATIFCSTTE